MENKTQTNTNKKSNPAILIGLIVLIIAIVGYGVWQSTNKQKSNQEKETTTVSTTAETTKATETTTESTTQTTTTTTINTTKETTKQETDYYRILANTTWTYYFGEHDKTSILEFYDNNTLHYYHIDGELQETTSDMYGKYEINGNNLIVRNSDTGETENYTIRIIYMVWTVLKSAELELLFQLNIIMAKENKL